jgi:hypothetical protein
MASLVVLRAIGAGGPLGLRLADIICDLVVKGAELGELETYPYQDHDEWQVGKRMPREWLDRLAKAIETGAIEHVSTERIVEILLQGQR